MCLSAAHHAGVVCLRALCADLFTARIASLILRLYASGVALLLRSIARMQTCVKLPGWFNQHPCHRTRAVASGKADGSLPSARYSFCSA